MTSTHIPYNFIIFVVLWLILTALFIAFIVLVVKALLKYLRSSDTRKESAGIKKNTGKGIKNKPHEMPDDTGVCGRSSGREPSGGVQVGEWSIGAEHIESTRPGEAVWRVC